LQYIRTFAARSWESFVIDGKHYLVVAHASYGELFCVKILSAKTYNKNNKFRSQPSVEIAVSEAIQTLI